MKTAALQSGITPSVCPHTRTQCASAVDAAAFAQLIRQLEEERVKNRQLRQELAEAKKQVKVKDEQVLELIKRLPEQTASPAKTNKKTKQKRAGQKEIKIRNCVIAAAIAEITLTYDRLPTVSEVMEKTALTRQHIYGSPLYKEGRIARASAQTIEAMTGSSVQKTELFGIKSQEHHRSKNRSKAERVEIDAAIDRQTEDDNSHFVVIR